MSPRRPPPGPPAVLLQLGELAVRDPVTDGWREDGGGRSVREHREVRPHGTSERLGVNVRLHVIVCLCVCPTLFTEY